MLLRRGDRNGNWKGGLSNVRCADDILELPIRTRMMIQEKIYTKIAISGECWNWIGGVFKNNNRPRLSVGRNGILAYKAMYVFFFGHTNGFCVCHTCDNPMCIRPTHLFLGTNADNSADMVAKGRSMEQIGSKNNAAKLTEDKVKDIKNKLLKGYTLKKLAKMYGVTKSTIHLISQCKRWSHV